MSAATSGKVSTQAPDVAALIRATFLRKPMTFDDVRKFALLWDEVEDGTSYGTPALKVRKKLLARLREDNDSLVMPGVLQDEREMLIESQPKVFYFTDHYRDYPMVLIRLSKASRAVVEPLLRRHWRTLASKKAVKEFDDI